MLLIPSAQVPPETTPYSHSLSSSSVITTISAFSIEMSPPCACTSLASPATSHLHVAFATTSPDSELSTRKWVSLLQPWSPSRCPACSKQPISPCERHSYEVFPSFPHCSIATVDQPLLTYFTRGHCTMVTLSILSRALATLLHDLRYDAGLFSLHS